ncbi:MAG: hypothetical protein WBC68_03995 [Albidovulum sp.]
MKIAAAILSRFAKPKADAQDPFGNRLATMDVNPIRKEQQGTPMLFHRAARAAA